MLLLLNKYKNPISILFIILGGILPYVGVNTELIGRDEAYQALCVRDYLNCPIAMFIFYIGNLWTKCVGDNILNLRYLMVACYQFSIAISCLYLFYKSRHLLLSSTIFLMMCAGFKYTTMTLYGWDSGIYPSLTLFTISLLWYLHKPSIKKIILIGIITAIMVMSRVTTAAALPLILICIIYTRGKQRDNRIRHAQIFFDSATGITFFILTSLIIILIMTNGDPSKYIGAWNPDNIINGHFEKDFIIWRWKDVSRRVLTAFYPMLFCFACAAYMLYVKRDRKIAFAICILTSAILSFYFLKTYRLHFEYASGIFESLYLIILLIPWLSNLISNIEKRIPIIPLTIITICALIAGVGSDGFLERPMTVNTIPLLCAYVFPQHKRIIRYLIAFSFISTLSMYSLVMISDHKNRTNDYSSKPHLGGILTNNANRVGQARFNQISKVIEYLNQNGIKHATFGTDRYEFDYVYRVLPSYNLQHFHYFDKENDISLLQRLANEYTYILEIHEINGNPYPNSDSYLTKRGYHPIMADEYYTLFKRESD